MRQDRYLARSYYLSAMSTAPPTILITGAAGGIGAATARRFADRGYFVGLLDVNAEPLQHLATELAERCFHAVTDVTDPQSCRRALLEFTKRTDGRLDILLNNAGITAVGDFETIPLERNLAIVDVNLKGGMMLTQLAFPYLRDTPNSQVLFLASASSLHGNPELVSYALTKRALLSLAESLDLSWERHGIRAKTLNPIYVRTNLVTDTQHLHRNLTDRQIELSADDVARELVRVVSSKRVHHYLGGQTKLFSRIRGILPFGWRRRIMRDSIDYR